MGHSAQFCNQRHSPDTYPGLREHRTGRSWRARRVRRADRAWVVYPRFSGVDPDRTPDRPTPTGPDRILLEHLSPSPRTLWALTVLPVVAPAWRAGPVTV